MVTLQIEILNAPETAALWGSTNVTVLKAINNGSLPAYRLSGKSWLILRADAERVLAERKSRKRPGRPVGRRTRKAKSEVIAPKEVNQEVTQS